VLAGMTLVGVWTVTALAADVVTHVNPTGAVSGLTSPDPVIPTNGEPVCGALDFDGVNGFAAQRRDDIGLESWGLANCEFSDVMAIAGMIWWAIDDSDSDWIGLADYAIWDADTVENGCADDSTVIIEERDIANTREPLLDDNGNQVVLFGRNAWIYTVKFSPMTFKPGKYYFAPRTVLETGQSFILTRDCNGDKEAWFQSEFFGFPCAVPSQFFPECVAIAPFGEAVPPEPACIYQVKKVKAKAGVCGEPCAECSYTRGDLLCTVPCDPDAPDCEGRLKGFNACADGGACKVKADNVGCDRPPDGCRRCG